MINKQTKGCFVCLFIIIILSCFWLCGVIRQFNTLYNCRNRWNTENKIKTILSTDKRHRETRHNYEKTTGKEISVDNKKHYKVTGRGRPRKHKTCWEGNNFWWDRVQTLGREVVGCHGPVLVSMVGFHDQCWSMVGPDHATENVRLGRTSNGWAMPY